MQSSSCYSARFGSPVRAYTMLGWEPHGDLSYVEINRSIRRRHVNRTLSIIDELFFARTRANTEVSENGITKWPEA